jgi:hypothetical protein
MKSHIQKEMRKIRLKLKKHDIMEYEKSKLREKLEELRVRLNKERKTKS